VCAPARARRRGAMLRTDIGAMLRTEQNREKRSTWIRRARAPQPPVRRAGYILVRTQPKSYNLTSARQASPVSAIGAAQRSLARQPAPSCLPPPARSAEGHGFALTVLPGRPCSCDV
jgi:hypothetical protein